MFLLFAFLRVFSLSALDLEMIHEEFGCTVSVLIWAVRKIHFLRGLFPFFVDRMSDAVDFVSLVLGVTYKQYKTPLRQAVGSRTQPGQR